MANHPQTALQARLCAILTGDATLLGLLASSTSVYDGVPDGAAFPYLTFGEVSLGDWGSHTHDGFLGTVMLHTWTRSGGRKSNQAILNRLYAVLHNTDIAVTDFPTISFRCELTEILLDPDGRTYHGVQRYRVMLGGN